MTKIIGILNLTLDSFSDGGKYYDRDTDFYIDHKEMWNVHYDFKNEAGRSGQAQS